MQQQQLLFEQQAQLASALNAVASYFPTAAQLAGMPTPSSTIAPTTSAVASLPAQLATVPATTLIHHPPQPTTAATSNNSVEETTRASSNGHGEARRTPMQVNGGVTETVVRPHSTSSTPAAIGKIVGEAATEGVHPTAALSPLHLSAQKSV